LRLKSKLITKKIITASLKSDFTGCYKIKRVYYSKLRVACFNEQQTNGITGWTVLLLLLIMSSHPSRSQNRSSRYCQGFRSRVFLTDELIDDIVAQTKLNAKFLSQRIETSKKSGNTSLVVLSLLMGINS